MGNTIYSASTEESFSGFQAEKNALSGTMA